MGTYDPYMGFGNFIPFEQKAPPDPTFGELREDLLGYTVLCRKCRHARFIGPKEGRFLRERLPDHMKLRKADHLFRCTQCNGNRVILEPEDGCEQLGRLRRECGLPPR